jgi:choline dehydrogenase
MVHGWARGKVLGGSSAINCTYIQNAFNTYTDLSSQHLVNMFSMASRQDLDNWAELGNKGWGFEDLLPYYRRFETYHPAGDSFAEKVNDKYLDATLRGTSGPIHVSHYMPLPSRILISTRFACRVTN